MEQKTISTTGQEYMEVLLILVTFVILSEAKNLHVDVVFLRDSSLRSE